MQVGDRLKEYRLKKNLTQLEVAEKLNLSRQSVSKWENNRTYPEIDNLKMLGDLYEVSIDELLDQSNITEEKKITDTNSLVKKNDCDVRKKIKLLFLLSVSVLVPFLGIVVPIIILFINMKNKNSFEIIYFLCLLGFVINSYGCLTLFKG